MSCNNKYLFIFIVLSGILSFCMIGINMIFYKGTIQMLPWITIILLAPFSYHNRIVKYGMLQKQRRRTIFLYIIISILFVIFMPEYTYIDAKQIVVGKYNYPVTIIDCKKTVPLSDGGLTSLRINKAYNFMLETKDGDARQYMVIPTNGKIFDITSH